MIRHIYQAKQKSNLINPFTGKRYTWGLKEPIHCEKTALLSTDVRYLELIIENGLVWKRESNEQGLQSSLDLQKHIQ
jgi:hypothetical protein